MRRALQGLTPDEAGSLKAAALTAIPPPEVRSARRRRFSGPLHNGS